MTASPKRATQSKSKSARKTPAKAPKQKIQPIKFTATIGAMKVTSRSNNVTFAIPLSDVKQISRLMESRLPDQYLEIVATIKKKVKKVKDGSKAKRQGYRGNRRRERFNPYRDRNPK